MFDASEVLSRSSNFAFKLDEQQWPSVEHYYQAMKFDDKKYHQTIAALATADEAKKFSKKWTHKFKIRKDWKKIKTTVMTRALYIKCKTHPEIAQRLVDTLNQPIVENSQFDYFWGCGRDKRGHNHYGKILINIRDKLNEGPQA